MFRDRFKNAARKAAIKLLNMEFDTQDRDPANRAAGNPDSFDPNKIPKVVDGSGDTPGPNHREDIGRTWVSAQLAGGVAPFFIDLRPPNEVTAGLLPGALLLPNMQVRDHLDLLPDNDVRVTVYDQTGEQNSTQVAQWLREQGWLLARRLRGGYVEWIEHGEPIESPESVDGSKHKVGDPVRMDDGRTGFVQAIAAGCQYTVWLESGECVGPIGEDALVD